jgi:outer membrane protein assembly factor BamB
MKRFILIVLFISILYSQEKNIELEVIYEKTFDEPIVEVIFDTATVKIEEAKRMGWKENAFSDEEKSKGKVLVSYPKVVFIADPEKISFRKDETQIKEIRFYNKEGKLIKKVQVETEWLKREKVAISKNGKYIVVYKVPTEDNPENTGGALYKNDGTLIWEKKTKDSPIAVSDEGYVVSGELDWGTYPPQDFVFYDPIGKEIGRVKNPYRNMIETGVGYAQFSSCGKYVLIGYTFGFAKTTIILVTKEGEILWQKEIDDCLWIPTRESDFKEHIGVIGIGVGRKLVYFMSWKGNLKWTLLLDDKTEDITKLSEDGEKIYITDMGGYIWCIETKSGRILWKYKGDWPLQIVERSEDTPDFCEMKITGEKIYIVGKYIDWGRKKTKNKLDDKRLWYSSVLFIFNSENGNLIQKIEYPDKRITLISKEDKLFISEIDSKKLFGVKLKEVEK